MVMVESKAISIIFFEETTDDDDEDNNNDDKPIPRMLRADAALKRLHT